MVYGTAAVFICYLILGWAKEIAMYFSEDPATVWQPKNRMRGLEADA